MVVGWLELDIRVVKIVQLIILDGMFLMLHGITRLLLLQQVSSTTTHQLEVTPCYKYGFSLQRNPDRDNN